ncbi:MAG: hypothetical protein ACYST6_17045 [Planctomycetota bacterium]|jgi:hypothetical protein
MSAVSRAAGLSAGAMAFGENLSPIIIIRKGMNNGAEEKEGNHTKEERI